MFNVTLMKTINPWVLSLSLQQCLKYVMTFEVFLFLLLPPDAAEVEQILSETCCEDENHRQDNSSSHHCPLLLPHGRNSNGLFWAEINPLGHILYDSLLRWLLILLQNVQNAPRYETGCQDDFSRGYWASSQLCTWTQVADSSFRWIL